MSRQTPSMKAGLKALADGEWHPGMWLMEIMGQNIHDSHAARYYENLTGPKESRTRKPVTDADMARMGRKRIVHEQIWKQYKSGRWEFDQERMTDGHWCGDLPWQIRDKFAGYLRVPEAAAELGVPDWKLMNLVRSGRGPELFRQPGSTHWFVTPDVLETYREMLTGPKDLKPRKVAAVLECPRCGGELAADMTVTMVNLRAADG